VNDDFLRWRQIEAPCETCHGSGGRVYGSTATWRGGMGGAAMTYDVCDRCWGSGDRGSPWTDLRRLRNERDEEVARLALDRFERAAGAPYGMMKLAAREIADELDRLARGRKERAPYFVNACRSLARALRESAK
jgi:hypothetical protein